MSGVVATMQRRAVISAGLALLITGCGREPAPAVAAVRVPDLPMVDLDGASVRLQAWHGRRLVLNVWASWCAPCRAELPSLQVLSDRLDPARAAVVGLAVDEDQLLVREFLRRTPLRFPVYLQPDGPAVSRALQVRALPETLVFSEEGVLEGRETGPRDWADPALQARWSLPGRRAAEGRGDA